MTTTQNPVDQQTVEEILEQWPDEPAEIARKTIDKYGQPVEAAPSELLWHDTGPWKRTELYRDGVPHHFPKKHTDYLKQVIDYRVSPETFDDLGQFDGSVHVDRTNGELAARCHTEWATFPAINLAHALLTDGTSVKEARRTYAEDVIAKMNGETPPRTEGFRFELPDGPQVDRDEAIIQNGTIVIDEC